MIIKIIIVILEIIVSYLLQTTVFSDLRLADVVPDIFLILVASNAFMFGKNAGCIIGFISGLILDLTFGGLIGVYALIFTVCGFICGFANKLYYHRDYTLPLFIIGGGEFLYNMMYFVLFFVLNGNIDFGHFLVRYLCPRVIYTVIVSIILYRLINLTYYLFRKIDRKKKDRAESVIEYNGLDLFYRRNL